MSKIPVLLPGTPMPAYSYVPGKFPHPIRDRQGHSFGEAAEEVTDFDPRRWQECKVYLRGIDLFNHGYYWEAHEAWEAVWHAVGREGVVADFIKGLIKLTAACVKAREGSAIGVARHATRGGRLFRTVQAALAAESSMLGLSLVDLQEIARQMAAGADRLIDKSDEPVVRIHEFLFEPK